MDNLRLDNADVTELLLSVLSGDGRGDDNVVTREPVDGAGDTVLVSGLQSVDNTEDLSGVTTSGGGVGHDQTDLLAGVDDEDGTDGESHAWNMLAASSRRHSRTMNGSPLASTLVVSW